MKPEKWRRCEKERFHRARERRRETQSAKATSSSWAAQGCSGEGGLSTKNGRVASFLLPDYKKKAAHHRAAAPFQNWILLIRYLAPNQGEATETEGEQAGCCSAIWHSLQGCSAETDLPKVDESLVRIESDTGDSFSVRGC